MALSRLYEEPDVSPELRRLYDEVRSSFDLPYVPTCFKLLAGAPDYLHLAWEDLGTAVRSREFHAASKALVEFVHSLTISGGWRFSDQQRVLTAQKFSWDDIEQLGGIASTFARATAQTSLFVRMLQKGYSGGQAGRISNGRQASAQARMVSLHVPGESEAGLRAWLIFSDIRRSLGSKTVPSLFRLLSPFPGYLAAVWLDGKKILADPAFVRAREEVGKRALGLLTGIPVKDHRVLGKQIPPQQWRGIEETVDAMARQAPQFALLTAIWHRCLTHPARNAAA